jgi:hypothetical protein
MALGRCNKNTAQAIATATSTVVQLVVLNQYVGITWDATNYRFVITQAGRYAITGSVCYAATPPAACRVEASLAVNDSDTSLTTMGAPVITNSYPSAKVLATRDLSVGDTVTLKTYQSSGSSYSTHTNVNATFLELVQLY